MGHECARCTVFNPGLAEFDVAATAVDNDVFRGIDNNSVPRLCNVQFREQIDTVGEGLHVDIACDGNQLHASSLNEQAERSDDTREETVTSCNRDAFPRCDRGVHFARDVRRLSRSSSNTSGARQYQMGLGEFREAAFCGAAAITPNRVVLRLDRGRYA